MEYIDNKGMEFPDIVQKRNVIRFLQANDYKVKPAVKELQQHLEWREKYLPIIITPVQKELIDFGYLYTHGRDKIFRPLVVHNPKVFKTIKPDIEEALLACHFVMQYIIEHSKFKEIRFSAHSRSNRKLDSCDRFRKYERQ
jgi:hypothetical protein